MSSASSSRRRSFRALALVALIAAVPAACLDLEGLAPSGTSSTGGMGGTGSTSSTGDTTSTSTSTSSASSSSGGPTPCTAGMVEDCNYSGPAGTEGKGACKAGKHTCQNDGMSFGPCLGEVLPSVENCTDAVDNDCSGAPTCMGTTLGGAGFGGVSTNDDEVVFAVTTDNAGNIVLGGVEGSTGNGYLDYSIYSGNAAVSKLDPTGKKLWSNAVTVAGTGYAVIRGVATDTAGDVLILGEYQESIVGGDFTLPKADVVDIFLIKLLGATGKLVWQKQFTGPNEQYAHALALDKSGNIFVTGRTYGPVNFGGGATSFGGNVDLFVAKLDKDGNHVWSKAYGDGQPQVGTSIATTPGGDVVVAGSLVGTMDFGAGKTITAAGGDDIFVARLKGDTGVGVWANQYGDSNNQQANGVAVGSDSSVVITGAMVGKFGFGGMVFDAHSNSDVFVVKLNADGTHAWSHGYGSDNENQAGLGVTIDPAQNIAVVGYLKGVTKFGTTTLTDAAPNSAPETDLFVAKIAADGTALWAHNFGDTEDQAAWAVTTDASANVIVGGSYKGTMNFPPSITATKSYDAFWLKLTP